MHAQETVSAAGLLLHRSKLEDWETGSEASLKPQLAKGLRVQCDDEQVSLKLNNE